MLSGTSCIKTSICYTLEEAEEGSHAPEPVCAGQKTVIRRNQPFRNRRMTRRTFQTITQRWKITDISGAGTGKLRLHQLRNSPTTIKNAIKVIRRCSCVSKRFPIARRTPISAPRARVTSYTILNKMVIFFFLLPGSARDSAPPLMSRLSKIYRDIARSRLSLPRLENKFSVSPPCARCSKAA